MSDPIELLNDPVSVYLQGEHALFPVKINEKSTEYWIGSDESRLKIIDSRKAPREALQLFLENKNGFESADIFNQAAMTRVAQGEDTCIKITLSEIEEKEDLPILWLGVLRDNKFPNYDTRWEFLRPLDDGGTAIAVLINS